MASRIDRPGSGLNHGDASASGCREQGSRPWRDGILPVEEALDPEGGDSLRALGHQLLDDLFNGMATVRDRSVWQPVPDAARERLRAPVLYEPSDARHVYEEFKQAILPYPTANTHPRFWGWVMGSKGALSTPATGSRCGIAD